MRIHTHLGKSIDCIEPNKAKYDKNIKELLADVQILSRILKYTVAETAHMTLVQVRLGVLATKCASCFA